MYCSSACPVTLVLIATDWLTFDHLILLVLEGPPQRWFDLLHVGLHPKASGLLHIRSGSSQGTLNLLQGILGLFIVHLQDIVNVLSVRTLLSRPLGGAEKNCKHIYTATQQKLHILYSPKITIKLPLTHLHSITHLATLTFTLTHFTSATVVASIMVYKFDNYRTSLPTSHTGYAKNCNFSRIYLS